MLLAAALFQAPIVMAPATDDVWVYTHAADQSSDPFLRAWGGPDGQLSGSVSVMRFAIPEKAVGAPLVTLVLHLDAGLEISSADAKAEPIEIRLAKGDVNETTWSYSQAAEVMPASGDEAIIGKGWPETDDFDQHRPVRIRLDQNAAFKAKWASLKAGDSISLAITTKMQPEGAQGAFYRFASRNSATEGRRPYLEAAR
jgi:hypothetical protein